jgi:hypothetical protein
MECSRILVLAFVVLCSGVSSSSALGQAAAPPPSPEASPPPVDPNAQRAAIYSIIAGAKGPIDACTAAYLKEYPAEKGAAQLSMTVEPQKGEVTEASATCPLQGSRNLVTCLELVGRSLAFPGLGSGQIGFPVEVRKGASFAVADPSKPSPKPKQEQAPAKKDDGFVQFSPVWSTIRPQEKADSK